MSAAHQAPDRTAAGTEDGDRVADDVDVLRRLRTETAAEHQAVEESLDLLSPDLSRDRLVDVLTRMHGFWQAAEADLDGWADAHPADAERVDWAARHRSDLFAADLAALGAAPADPADGPELPAVPDTDAALGRLYVLEGSSLGGVFIDRHLATLPQLAATGRMSCFSPYGERTGAMWHAFRTVTRARVAAGGDAGRLVDAARQTFGALATWCSPVQPRRAVPLVSEVSS
jgi:heme oxygenase (biliverdin-IX-beta and delta-forming)